MLTYIKNILSPPFCIACERLLPEHQIVCVYCWQNQKNLFSQTITYASDKQLVVHALFTYEPPVRDLLLGKLSGNAVSVHQLAQLVARRLSEYQIACDYVVPIPLHWYRRWRRGFNQADILGDYVARALQVPLVPALRRVRYTQFQSQLSAEDRVKNVRAAFAVKDRYAKLLAGKKVLLIDDLFTTGATVSHAARAMAQAGVHDIQVLVACKAVV